jgi:hypothetical protein
LDRLWKKDTSIGDRISVSGTHHVHGYRSQHLQLDGRIGEQYFVDGTVEQLNNGLMITCDKSLTHNVALWSTSLIPKLNPFFIPFWCFMASNALTILHGLFSEQHPGQFHYTITGDVRFGWILGDRTGRDTISAQLVQRTHKRSMGTVHYFDSGIVPYIYFNGLKAS